MEGLTTAIRERVADHGLTQAAAARALGIGRQTFSRKLNGHGDFSVSELTRLAEILGTTVADLMQRADQIANADVAPSAAGYAIKDERSGVVIMQASRVDFGGEAA
nr:MAG TPA: Helix-turn-helix XRE-family like protein [Caudoviricetes sp.]